MRKQELIHMHGLVAEVTAFCKENGATVDLDNYDQLETLPTSIQHSKGAHKEAVFLLTEAIVSSLDDAPVDAVSAEQASAD